MKGEEKGIVAKEGHDGAFIVIVPSNTVAPSFLPASRLTRASWPHGRCHLSFPDMVGSGTMAVLSAVCQPCTFSSHSQPQPQIHKTDMRGRARSGHSITLSRSPSKLGPYPEAVAAWVKGAPTS